MGTSVINKSMSPSFLISNSLMFKYPLKILMKINKQLPRLRFLVILEDLLELLPVEAFIQEVWSTPSFSSKIINVQTFVVKLLSCYDCNVTSNNGCRMYVDILTGKFFLPIKLDRMVLVYWSVRSSSRRRGWWTEESLF